MNTVFALGIIFLFMFVCVASQAVIHEAEFVKRAEKSGNMLNFYHILTLMTSTKYKNYTYSEKEKMALEEFNKQKSERDVHPIGGYFKLLDENKSTCETKGNFHNYHMNFNPSEMQIGLSVLVAFIAMIVIVVLA